MAFLSEDNRDIIAKHPLNNSLDLVRDLLRDAERSYESQVISCDGTVDDLDQTYRKAMSKLLSTLQGEEAALNLHLKTSNRDVASELFDLFNRIRYDFNYNYYRTLSQLVIQKAPDVDIWNAVFDLIITISRLTPTPTIPPSAIPPSFDSTPIIHSSASLQGNEQTREMVERKVFEEIRFCTYHNVEGFFEKYFERKNWTHRALKVYEAIKKRHVDGAWIDFPNPSVQGQVLDWWFRFQDEFLSGQPRQYYSTEKPTDLTGAEPRRQIDLFLKRNRGQRPGEAHNWRDVEVIGELKASNQDKKGTLLQLGRYVRDVFSCQPTRRYVHAFAICGHNMEAWVFDRSGCYSSGLFNIDERPERFIQMIAGYTMMNEDELGLDTFTEQDGDGYFINIEQDETKGRKQLWLKSDAFTRQRAIVCRGTSCFLTKASESDDWNYVTKFSWTSDRRKLEADLLRLANQRGVQGVAKLIAYRRITSINEMRSGLTFTKPYPFRVLSSTASPLLQSLSQSQASGEFHNRSIADKPSTKRTLTDSWNPSKRSKSASRKSNIAYQENKLTYAMEDAEKTSLFGSNSESTVDNRILCCLVVYPAGRAIYNFDRNAPPLLAITELLEALRDAIKAHQSLYLVGNILHRDISENNIIVTDPAKVGGFKGMLIDLDLAKEVDIRRSSARRRTGTMEFMAIEVLLGYAHTYRHDLESFFYVLIWQCARRGWGEKWPNNSLLTYWYTGSYQGIASVKHGSMHARMFEYILDEFPPLFDCVKPLCRSIREILFLNELFIGTPPDPEKLYRTVIKAFDDSIAEIKAREIPT